MDRANKNRRACKAFYRVLLTLYPQAYRERFGESMLQTFDDVCNEEPGTLLLLTLRTSIDTGVGIVREHFLYLSQRGAMASILRNPKFAAILGLLLFLPGALMFSFVFLGIDAPTGAIKHYVEPADPDAPHILGSLLFLTFIVVLPAVAVLINIAATEENVLDGIISNLGLCSLLAFFLVLPLIALELTFGQKSYSSFPFGLFGIIWTLSLLFFLALAPLIKNIRAGESIVAHPFALILRIAFLLLIAAFLAGLIEDQMPCFLGVPNCD